MEDPKKAKEALLMERIVELINSSSSGFVRCNIRRFMRKDNINSVINFMSIGDHRPSEKRYDRGYVYMGPKTYQRIGEIQKIIAKENKKELKRVSVTTYEWRLV